MNGNMAICVKTNDIDSFKVLPVWFLLAINCCNVAVGITAQILSSDPGFILAHMSILA